MKLLTTVQTKIDKDRNLINKDNCREDQEDRDLGLCNGLHVGDERKDDLGLLSDFFLVTE